MTTEVTLRPELQKHCDEFSSWWESELTHRDEQSKVTAPLYHYTNAAGLLGILESECVWHTSIFHLNDPSEFAYGLGVAVDELDARAKGTSPMVQLFCEAIANALKSEIGATFGFFLACFSDNRDDLGQWRAYADNGRGFSVGFAPHLFHGQDREPESPADTAFITSVEYERAVVERNNKEALERAIEALQKMHSIADSQQEVRGFMKEMSILLSVPILWNSLGAKSSGYQHEKERRVVIMNDIDKLLPHIDLRARGTSLVPFIRRSMELRAPGNVVEIVAGPASDQETEYALYCLLGRHGLLEHVPIRRSKIPYRAL